jgi:hypothetical protein
MHARIVARRTARPAGLRRIGTDPRANRRRPPVALLNTPCQTARSGDEGSRSSSPCGDP